MILENITKIYDKDKEKRVIALSDINLIFDTSGIISILGPSGSGKSSLLHIIGGRDNRFIGKIENEYETYLLSQDFELLNKMSVFDNLLLVHGEKEHVENLLERYELLAFKNKKVEKLSNGQKKRVQFIQALLAHPQVLLCDEVTASLDHEQVVKMMDDLKELSKQSMILFVTHDRAIAEKYSDRIIEIEGGKVISDTIKQKCQPLDKQQPMDISDKKLNEIFLFTIRQMMSTLIHTFGKLTVILSCAIVAFLSISLINTIYQQNTVYESFKNSRNFLVSIPNNSVKRSNQVYAYYYEDGDTYSLEEIQSLIEIVPQIIGVEAFYSSQYTYGIDNASYYYQNNEKIFKNFPIQSLEMENAMATNIGNIPLSIPFLLDEREDYVYFLPQVFIRDDYYNSVDHVDYAFKNQLNIYHLVNDYDLIPILYGKYPESENDIMIDLNAARMVVDFYDYEQVDQLIGKEISIYNYSTRNHYTDANIYKFVYPVVDKFTLKICGITGLENSYSKMAFIGGEIGNDVWMNEYVKDKEKLFYQYVHFIVDPKENIESVAASINEYLRNDNSRICVYDGTGYGNTKIVFKEPSSFIKLDILLIVIAFIFMVGIETISKKRRKKEMEILSKFHMSVLTRVSIEYILYAIIASLMIVSIMPSIALKLNEWMQINSYIGFVTIYSFIEIICVIGVSGIVMIIDWLLIKNKRSRRSV